MAAAEFLGAMALVVGLLSRFMSASIVLVMAGAVFLVSGEHFSWAAHPRWATDEAEAA